MANTTGTGSTGTTGATTSAGGGMPSEAPDAGSSKLQEGVAPGTGDKPENELVGVPDEEQSAVSTDDSKDDLKKAARKRDLDDSGTKQELVDRITEHDDEGVHKPEVLYPHESE